MKMILKKDFEKKSSKTCWTADILTKNIVEGLFRELYLFNTGEFNEVMNDV